MIRVHGDHKTTDRPEYTIFYAADHPDPVFGQLVGRGSCDHEMDEGDDAYILGVNVEQQEEGEKGLDRAGEIHPELRRLETDIHVELQRLRHRDLADDMRNEEQRADDAQKIEFVEQVEFIG